MTKKEKFQNIFEDSFDEYVGYSGVPNKVIDEYYNTKQYKNDTIKTLFGDKTQIILDSDDVYELLGSKGRNIFCKNYVDFLPFHNPDLKQFMKQLDIDDFGKIQHEEYKGQKPKRVIDNYLKIMKISRSDNDYGDYIKDKQIVRNCNEDDFYAGKLDIDQLENPILKKYYKVQEHLKYEDKKQAMLNFCDIAYELGLGVEKVDHETPAVISQIISRLTSNMFLKIEEDEEVILSIDPIDFMQMSNGEGWTSCLNDDFAHTRISYLTSPDAMIIFSRKIGSEDLQQRAVIGLNETGLVIGPTYPDANDYRLPIIAKNCIEEKIGEFSIKNEGYTILSPADDDELDYVDLCRGRKSIVEGNVRDILIDFHGEELCLHCSKPCNLLHCHKCVDNCYNCGDPVYKNGFFDVNGNIYCSCCGEDLIYNEADGEYYPQDEMCYCEHCDSMYTEDYMVSDDCCLDCSVRCDECGEGIPIHDSLSTMDDKEICWDCCERNYTEYEGEYYPDDDCVEVDGKMIPKSELEEENE